MLLFKKINIVLVSIMIQMGGGILCFVFLLILGMIFLLFFLFIYLFFFILIFIYLFIYLFIFAAYTFCLLYFVVVIIVNL